MGSFLPFSFVAIFVIAAVVAVGYADISPEVYWKKVLPNTPIPNSILEKLHAEVIDEKTGNSVDVGKRVNVNADASFIIYRYAASADKLHDDPNVALSSLRRTCAKVLKTLFTETLQFIERVSTKFNMFFPNISKSGPKFLPRNVVDAIPFSSAKISETLKHFSIEPNSLDAKTMMKTIKECEEPAIKGETKYCATSLESMVDFANSTLGTNIKALATETKKEAPKQLYTIAPGVHKMASPKTLGCHIKAYVHTVYYCHQTSDTTAYVVPLVGKDKVKVDTVAVCHKDTSQWNPKHMAFQKLKVKPGSVPICHFIPLDHIVWVQN
ncbi:BURP domain-containing protein [Cinnamomum micranthum f. kanehirae]|uniref:BURP domain-containing protein n=1 Tax=Cinnamomum micranthum f. kanehirae TaxID=337451 RepID=A0A3S3PV32_9MAGN|nr:BURP domain-containing protein [Cinnamomum micranthum f. kanehirae]